MRRLARLTLLFVILSTIFRLPLQAQAEWMWLEGSSSTGQPGDFGTLGVSASSNIPSARSDTGMWRDSAGKRWFFGGFGYDSVGTFGYLNDLWRFDPTTLQWTWMGGSKTIPKVSGSILGQPGVYGTLGVSAAGNIPGGRSGASSWTDSSGVFWLFGGRGFDSVGNYSILNDLWRFDPSTGQWTWTAGSNTDACSGQSSPPCGQSGFYGTQGVAGPSNLPGGRWGASDWTDAKGNFWLFGGFGVDSAGNYGDLNDLWEFSPSSQQWTWLAGNNLASQVGVYGTLGVFASANTPGGRGGAASLIDNSGNFWLFGGSGTNLGAYGYLNELWVFNPSTTEWAWMSGSSTQAGNAGGELYGVYGTLGVFSPSNVPSGRYGAAGWIDSAGNLWLFGGTLFEAGYLNDVWEFEPSTQEWAWMGGSDATVIGGNNGTYGTQGVPAATNIPGGRWGTKIWTDGSENVWLFGGFGCGTGCGGDSINDLWLFGANFNLQVTPTVTVAPSQSSVGAGQSLSVMVSVAGGPVPTGSVTLAGGSFISSATTLNQGSATIDVPAGSLSLGSATLTVTYTPDTAGSIVYKTASGTASVSVVTSTYSLSATKVNLSPGSSGSSTVTVNSSTGYAGTVTLTCAVTSSPSGAVDPPTCSASGPATLSSSMTTTTATVTVITTGASSGATVWPRFRGPNQWSRLGTLAVLFLATCVGMSSRRRRSMSIFSVVLLWTVVGSLVGCGGSSTKGTTNPGTTPGTYTVTVTGTGNDASSTKVTTTFTLIVG